MRKGRHGPEGLLRAADEESLARSEKLPHDSAEHLRLFQIAEVTCSSDPHECHVENDGAEFLGPSLNAERIVVSQEHEGRDGTLVNRSCGLLLAQRSFDAPVQCPAS
jgi:hypothetical protein